METSQLREMFANLRAEDDYVTKTQVLTYLHNVFQNTKKLKSDLKIL